MANYVEAHPEDAEAIKAHREMGQFVPVTWEGEFLMLVNRRSIETFPTPSPLPVEDYVVGMELLGVTFHVIETGHGRALSTSIIFEPPAWVRRATQLVQAFGLGREDEIAAFLIERGDTIIRTIPGEAA